MFEDAHLEAQYEDANVGEVETAVEDPDDLPECGDRSGSHYCDQDLYHSGNHIDSEDQVSWKNYED